MSEDFREASLEYHRHAPAGKITVTPTKPLANQRDLALAYSPGVAAACELIVDNPDEASSVTARGNLVAVITNGTAVLGLGAIGPLAAKPVMEGKGVLFKKFAGIDVFDIEIDERDPDKLVEIIRSLEPTFGGINLEDIKAPECFKVESALREQMNIPVFHDDQHGTAIITAAAIYNGLRLVEKKLEEVKLVASGAGASAIACLDLLVAMGLDPANVIVNDSKGTVYKGRTEYMDARKAVYAADTDARTLGEAIEGADIFLGLSAPGVLKPEMVERMADKPLILALANPTPEILPEEAQEARPDAIIATGRSDYPNQVNNVLCFPFIFRGALDVGATAINEEMKKACVKAIADLAMVESSDIVVAAYGGKPLRFGPDYLIPKPFDPRLIIRIAPAVAKAAMDSGVATKPIEDFDAYRLRLSQFVYQSGLLMKPMFERARQQPMRVVYGDGEEERVLSAVQAVVDDGLAKPILIGRRRVVEMRLKRLGLRLSQFVYQSGLLMKPMFERARQQPMRVVYGDGEEERVLSAVQAVVDDGLAKPILVGRRRVVEMRLKRLGLRLRMDDDFELVDPEDDPRYREYWTLYHSLMERRGVSPDRARTIVRTRNTVIAALMLKRGEADALLSGLVGRYERQLGYIEQVLGRRPGVRNLAAMNCVISPKGTLFLCDTYVNADPTAHQLAEMTVMAADEIRRFGLTPKVALLSHSSFGTSGAASAVKMREALELIEDRDPTLEVEGEMHGDAAINEEIRSRIFPNSRLAGQANLLILPTLDAANIAFNLLKTVTDSVSVGPILLGAAQPAHILTPSITTRGLVNMTALAAVEAAMAETTSAQ